MKTAIATGFDTTIPIGQAISLIRQAGFEAISLGSKASHSSYNTAEGRANLHKLLRENSLVLDSIHAPFPEGDRLFSMDRSEREESIRQCRTALDAAEELEAGIVVVHLIPYDIPPGETRDRMIEHGRQSVRVLAEYAGARGLKLALENGQQEDYDEVLTGLLTEFTDPHIGFCYDSGHEHVKGTRFEILRRFGDRLFTVHIHDNAGTDTHLLPYEGTIDWEQFRKVFHGLDYTGNLLLESATRESQFKDPAVFLAEAKARAERLLR